MMTRADLRWVGGLLGLAVLVGGVCGWIWLSLVPLPSYQLGPDHFAALTEAGHTHIFAADAWFAVLGLGAGVVLGWLAWSWMGHVGWGVTALAWAAGLVAGAVCWFIGTLFGPRNFAQRLAFAEPGDAVPIDLQIHAPSVLLIWALAAVLPVLVGALSSLLLPDGSLWPGRRGTTAIAAEPPTTTQETTT